MTTQNPNEVAAKAAERKAAAERAARPSPIRKDFEAAARKIRGESKAFGFKPAPLTGKTGILTSVEVAR